MPGPIILWSKNRGMTWSEPKSIQIDLPREGYTYHGMGNLIFFSETHGMFPVQLNNPEWYRGPNHHGAAAVFTKNGGES